MADTLLVVDDDPKILSMMRRGLIFAGYDVLTVDSGEEALHQAIAQVPDLVVLDVMLPGIDGFEVCRRLRAAEPRLPILLLTARDRVPDRVAGLDAGADDYLVKPFAFDELLARIRALLRRTSPESQEILSCDDLRVDTSTREVLRGARSIELTLTEYQLLEYLLRHQRQVLSRERIHDVIWGDELVIGSNVIDVYIKRLREKLEALGEPRLIQTVRGVGVLTAAVWRLNMSIRLRLAISHSVLAVGVFVLFGGLLYLFFEHSVRSDLDDSLRDRAIQVERVIVAAGDAQAAPPPAGGTGRVRVFTPAGQLLAEAPATGMQDVLEPDSFASALHAGNQTVTIDFDGGNRRLLYHPLVVDDVVEGVIEVSESLEPTERALARARLILLLAGVLALPGGLLAGWWMARQALVPVNRLTAAVGTLAASGEFGQRVPQPGGNDEIGQLARTFNDILERLTVVLDRQQTLVADTSHELRNPLMVVRGNLDLLVHDLPVDQRLEAVTEAREEVDRMARLVGDLLFLADADTHGSIDRRNVELDEILSDIVEDARRVSPDHVIDLNANDPLLVMGDAERLRQLIWNLVENAIRYTPADGTINLALRRRSRVAEILVSDTGIGIPEDHLPHVFNRFYRVDRGRSRALGGTGLGLSIVRQVAETHGGHVRVRSIPGIGSTFTVYLPLSESPEAAQPVGARSQA